MDLYEDFVLRFLYFTKEVIDEYKLVIGSARIDLRLKI
jgi:hypothetical protein